MGVFLGRVGDHMLKGEFNRKVLFFTVIVPHASSHHPIWLTNAE